MGTRKQIRLLLLLSLFFTGIYAAPPEFFTKNSGSFASKISDDRADVQNRTDQVLNGEFSAFIENRGQMRDMNGKPVPFVLFKAEVRGLNLYITEKGITYLFLKQEEEPKSQPTVFREKFLEPETRKHSVFWERIELLLEGAEIKKENVVAEKSSSTEFNYFLPHCPEGVYGVKTYEKISIKNIYPGIDWVLYNKGREGFKYDFIVHPGASPEKIVLVYQSLQALQADASGGLLLSSKYGSFKENAPYSYVQGSGKTVPSQFKVLSQQQHNSYSETKLGFELNTEQAGPGTTFVIDPQLVWSTFYGGSAKDEPYDADTDNSGNFYVTGITESVDLPVQSSPGAFMQGISVSTVDMFILKFSPASALLWATYYGGASNEWLPRVATDVFGNIFIGGCTLSTDFPLQNAGGGTYFQSISSGISGYMELFLIKFTATGVRTWATFYGGTSSDHLGDIATDLNGNLFVTGGSDSKNFPRLSAGTFFQNVNNGGMDLFILKFDNAGTRLWATFHGGGKDDFGQTIDCDPNGNVFVAGVSLGVNFPTQNSGAFFQGNNNGSADGVLMKFTNNGTRLLSTYYGGSGDEGIDGIACDQAGNVFVIGSTESANFPVQQGPGYFQGTIGNTYAVYLIKFDNQGNRLWATYYDTSVQQFPDGSIEVGRCGDPYFSILCYSDQAVTQPSCDGGYYQSTPSGTIPNNVKWGTLLVHMSNNGNLLWATYHWRFENNWKCPIALDLVDNLYVVKDGWASFATVDPGAPAYYDATPNGIRDLYISKLIPGSVPAASSFSYASPACTKPSTLSPSTPTGFTGGGTYSGGNGLTIDPTTGNIAAGNSTPGVYTVSYTPLACGCLTVTPSVHTITLTSVPNVSITTPILCNETSAVLNTTVSPASGISYTWLPGGSNNSSFTVQPASTTNYTLEISDAAGCRVSSVTQVTVLTHPPQISINSPTICIGESTTLTAFPTPAVAMNYTWLTNGQTTSSLVLNPAATSVYSLAARVGNCNLLATALVQVNKKTPPVIDFYYAGPYCITNPDAAPSLPLDFSQGGSYSAANLNIHASTGIIKLAGSTGGSYAVTYSVAAAGCKLSGSKTTQVILEAPPVLNLQPEIVLAPGSGTVITVSGGGTYQWSPANGLSCSDCAAPYASPSEKTTYCVISTSNNCKSEACVVIDVTCFNGQDFSVPNAFTPNGDGRNEAFCLMGWDLCVKDFSVLIFNRWGEKVFESSDADFCWDGIYKGKLLEADVYTYSIRALYFQDKSIFKKGTIALLR